MAEGPLDRLEALARQEVVISPTFRHLEVFTARGLLTLLWHGDPSASSAVVLGGGAMGGLLGPADGFYHWLGDELGSAGSGTSVLRVGWRRPNDLELCTLDLLAVADLAARAGAQRFVLGGHSFGGAVAVRAGALIGEWVAGVVTFAEPRSKYRYSIFAVQGPSMVASKSPPNVQPLRKLEFDALTVGVAQKISQASRMETVVSAPR